MSKTAYPDLINGLTSLNSFGFTQLQAAAYIALIQLGGQQTGSAIAEKSGINRSKIYDTLAQLEGVGAVEIIPIEGKTRYSAISPDMLFKGLVQKFSETVDSNKHKLHALMGNQISINPAKMTMTRIILNELNLDQFNYLITTNEMCRSKLLEFVGKENLPGQDVIILNLNDLQSPGLVLLISTTALVLFPSPVGGVVEAIQVQDNDITEFFTKIIHSRWTDDLPENILRDLKHEKLKGVKVGKSLRTIFNQRSRTGEYTRPVTYLITDTHLSFFYEKEENPKVPLFAVKEIDILEDNSMELHLKDKKGVSIGFVRMAPIDDPRFIRNLILTLSTKV